MVDAAMKSPAFSGVAMAIGFGGLTARLRRAEVAGWARE